jgi:hypothetical protein
MKYPEQENRLNKIVKQQSLISYSSERHGNTKWHLEMITLRAQLGTDTEN